ncbi:MAG: hypothetical protein JW936_02060 [Sedimentisphaerales bacterium]|nr:hypothetical protein [Sedimentisphaerales bacterium]
MRNVKWIVLFLLLGSAVSSYGYFYDDCAYVMGTAVVGQGDWVTNYNPGTTGSQGTAQPSLKQSDIKIFDGFGWNNGAYNYGGIARDISGDVVDGVYQLVVTFHGQAVASFGCNFQITIGDYGITDPNVTTANHLTLLHDDRTSVQTMYLYIHRNGVLESAGAPTASFAGAPIGQHQIKVCVDLNAGTASVYYRDVDNSTLEPLGDWNLLASWTDTLPMTSITQLGIAVSDYKYVYNIESGLPPAPVSCAAAQDAGYLLNMDLNDDCHVNLLDFAMFAGDWMRCVVPGETGCETPWAD